MDVIRRAFKLRTRKCENKPIKGFIVGRNVLNKATNTLATTGLNESPIFTIATWQQTGFHKNTCSTWFAEARKLMLSEKVFLKAGTASGRALDPLGIAPMAIA